MRRLLIFILIALPVASIAQSERGEVREGNKLYMDGNYKGAELKYRSALQTKGDSYEAMSNLGSALFKQKLSAEAQDIFKKVVETGDKLQPGELQGATYNLGNSYLQERKLDEAIESYKNALRLNPKDDNARFNLAYAQKLKKEQEGGGGQNQDKNQDQNQNQNQNQDPNKYKDKDKDKEQQEQPKPESRQDAERMLKALQDAENRTKANVDQNKPKDAVGSGRNKQW